MKACGRRWGKTTGSLIAAVLGHGPKRGVFRGALDGANIAWVAPDYTITDRVIWPDLIRSCGWPGMVSKKNRSVYFQGGGSVTVMSADNEKGLRGAGWDGMVIDEAAFIKETVWKQELRPSLADRQGWAIFITTPNGYNWFHKLFESAYDRPGWERWQRPTSDNPLIPKAELEAARLELGARAFAQEFEAKFTSMEGAWFDGAYFHDRLWFDEWPTSGVIHNAGAMDPSLGKSDKCDYTAIVYGKRVLENDRVVHYIDASLERRDTTQTVSDVIGLHDWFNFEAFGVEINQFQVLVAAELRRQSGLRNNPVPVYHIASKTPKKQRIMSLNPYFAADELRFKRHSRGARLLVDQIAAWPVDDYDDGPDGLEMYLQISNFLAGGGEQLPERVSA